MARLLVSADRFNAPSFDRLIRDAVEHHRWLEALKFVANRLGFDGYGRTAPLLRITRDAFVGTWDLVKDIVESTRRPGAL